MQVGKRLRIQPAMTLSSVVPGKERRVDVDVRRQARNSDRSRDRKEWTVRAIGDQSFRVVGSRHWTATMVRAGATSGQRLPSLAPATVLEVQPAGTGAGYVEGSVSVYIRSIPGSRDRPVDQKQQPHRRIRQREPESLRADRPRGSFNWLVKVIVSTPPSSMAAVAETDHRLCPGPRRVE